MLISNKTLFASSSNNPVKSFDSILSSLNACILGLKFLCDLAMGRGSFCPRSCATISVNA